jgi:hypothetical protein
MARDDEVPYIVIERERGGSIGSFVLGALVGAGLALLFAPQSGEETQEEIRRRARRLREKAEDKLRSAQEQLETRLDARRARTSSAGWSRPRPRTAPAWTASAARAPAAPRTVRRGPRSPGPRARSSAPPG